MPQPHPKNWTAISPSQFPWEQEALDFVHARFPASPEYLAWSNFEFVAADGSINETDLLIVSPWGAFFVEIKSRPGRLTGDSGAWTWIDENGRRRSDDNPLILANRKSKRLKDLLGRQPAFRSREVPFIQPLIFCSAPGLDFQLAADARNFICVRDSEDKSRPGIRAAIFERKGAGLRPATERLVDGPALKAFAQAMAQAGLRPQHRKVADFVLDRLRYESPAAVFQDWEAHHVSQESVRRLVRLFLASSHAAKEDRRAVTEAAMREFHILAKLNHPGILKASVPAECELGPAIVFEFDPSAQRLDHYLAEEAARLDVGSRLHILQQVADAIRHAHGKDVIHRALSPQSIFVLREKAGPPRVQIYNWHTGSRLADGSFSGLTNLTVSLHAAQLLEDPARAFLAPETLVPGEEPDAAMDVFSLGALAYFLFSGQPPARDAAELEARLRANPERALEIRDVLDGVSESIATLVRESTRAKTVERCTLDGFRTYLDLILDEITRREDEAEDPRLADKGNTLANGFFVERQLGKGASSVALLVTKGDARCVLKVAKDATFNRRLDAEFETLKKLQPLASPNIVKVFERYELHGLTAFTVELAGERTLARMLREDGPPDLELLQRYGEELIRAVESLDEHGIFHRDIKPENIGIGEAGGARAHKRLRLFDFSLAGAAPTELRVGTPDYLDPFLEDRRARRYDLSAELYAVAMTLHEIATGERAKWQGGKPSLTDAAITLRAERFDPNLREQFTTFFARAFDRQYRRRFDNARDMREAWSGIFETIDRPTAQSEHEADRDEILSETLLATATPGTAISLLGLGTRLMNVLDRLGIHSVTELLQFKFGRFEKFRGVGRKTQLELIKVMHRLRGRFPDLESGNPASATAPLPETLGVETVEVVARQVLAGKRGKAGETEAAVLRPFLGAEIELQWPSQSDLAEQARVSRQRIGQIVTGARERWGKSFQVASLRDAIAGLLGVRGGIMTHRELAAAILATRGSLAEDSERLKVAGIAVRAALETERAEAEPRFEEYRSDRAIFVASHPSLKAYAVALGEKADALAAHDPLPTSARVLELLREVRFPSDEAERPPLDDARLPQLAVAAAAHAALSSRGEIYRPGCDARGEIDPLGLDARRAFDLARNAMLGVLKVDDIQRRLHARFPLCGPLPARPELDEFLLDSHEWSVAADGEGTYLSKGLAALSPSLSIGSRQSTRTTREPGALTDPDTVEAIRIERRLRVSHQQGGYLILTVIPSKLEDARKELIERFDLDACDLDALFLETLRAEAARIDVSWEVILEADAAAPDSQDWENLQHLVAAALPRIEQRLRSAKKTCLALHPGLLARYGQMHLIGALAADVGRPGGPAGLWILAPANDQYPLPTIDEAPIPITNPNQHTRLTPAWLRNQHRAATSH